MIEGGHRSISLLHLQHVVRGQTHPVNDKRETSVVRTNVAKKQTRAKDPETERIDRFFNTFKVQMSRHFDLQPSASSFLSKSHVSRHKIAPKKKRKNRCALCTSSGTRRKTRRGILNSQLTLFCSTHTTLLLPLVFVFFSLYFSFANRSDERKREREKSLVNDGEGR